jgi:hypothetical protein
LSNRKTDAQEDRLNYIQMDILTYGTIDRDRLKYRKTDGATDRWIERKMEQQIGGQKERWNNRHMDREKE